MELCEVLTGWEQKNKYQICDPMGQVAGLPGAGAPVCPGDILHEGGEQLLHPAVLRTQQAVQLPRDRPRRHGGAGAPTCHSMPPSGAPLQEGLRVRPLWLAQLLLLPLPLYVWRASTVSTAPIS